MAETPSNTSIYGYLPSPQVKDEVAAKAIPIYGINFPVRKFSRDLHGRKRNNKLFSKVTGIELTRNNLIQFLNTEKGERVMRPNFGTDLNKYLFEQMDKVLFNLLTQDIHTQIKSYFPWLEVKEFRVVVNDKFSDVQSISANITIKDPIWGIDTFDTKISK